MQLSVALESNSAVASVLPTLAVQVDLGGLLGPQTVRVSGTAETE